MARRVLTRTERATARLYTGAVAHFVAGLADWLTFIVRHGHSRWRARRARPGSP